MTGTALLLFNTAGPFGAVELRRAFAKTVNVVALQRAYDRRRTSLFASFLLAGENDRSLEHAFELDTAAGDVLRDGLQGHDVRILTQPGNVAVVTGIIAQTLRSLNVTVHEIQAPYSGLYGADSPLRRGGFDLAINSYPYGDHADLASDWACANRAPAGGNFARWCDPVFDRAVRAADATSALRRLYDELVAIPLSRAYEDIGLGRRVCDVPAPPLLVPATYSCVSWRLC